jgi:hypothetical protein
MIEKIMERKPHKHNGNAEKASQSTLRLPETPSAV